MLMSVLGASEGSSQSRLRIGKTRPDGLSGWLHFGVAVMHTVVLPFDGVLHKPGSGALSIWLKQRNLWAGTPQKLWPNRVKLLNSSVFTSLLHFKEQSQLEQLGLNCRAECFRELRWLPQMIMWNLALVSRAQNTAIRLCLSEMRLRSFSFQKSISCTIEPPLVNPTVLFLAGSFEARELSERLLYTGLSGALDSLLSFPGWNILGLTVKFSML